MSSKYFDLKDKIAVVTGAGTGIGEAIASRFSAAGASIVVADIDEEAARRVGKALGGEDNTLAVKTDVTERASVETMISKAEERFGRIDILVNNAGIAGRSVPLWELQDSDWDQVLNTNLKSLFYCSRAVIRQMLEQQSGRIINIASIAGKEGNPNMIPYSSSKAGVIGFTKALAKEVSHHNILVNAITPAVIRTRILDQVTPEQVEYMASRIPLGRLGTSEEVAAVAHFLASDDASFVTGQVYDVSGGRATY